MSADLPTLLRDAADGPVPPLDVADLRRRGARRRRLTHAVAAAGVTALLLVSGVALAGVVGDAFPRPSVADAPEAPLSPEPEEPDPEAPQAEAEAGAAVEVAVERVGDRCSLQVVAQGVHGPLDGALWLPDERSVLCEAEPDEEDLARVELMTMRAPALDGTMRPEQLLIGLVEPDVVAVRVRTDLADVTVRTSEVATPGTAQLRAYAVLVPVADGATEPEDRRYTAIRADGSVDPEIQPTFALFDLEWAAEGPAEPGFETTGQPLDDVPITLPDEVPPLGNWRPARSPVDLSPFSARDTADWWFANDDPHEPAYPVAREVVADRLGGENLLADLCAFLHEEVGRATAEVDVAGEEPAVVAGAVVHLVLGQEEVIAGDAVTATIAHACGLPSTFDDRPAD